MSRATPLPYNQRPARTAGLGWVPGGASVGLAGLALLFTWIGYVIVHPHGAECPISEIWRGTLLAVGSVGLAVPGLFSGLVGVVCPRMNRLLALLGVLLNAGFALVFYSLWA